MVPGSVRSHPSSQRRALRLQRILKRRRRILLLLLWGSVVTLVSALLGGPGGWVPHLVLLVATIGFAAFLIETKRRRDERSRKVKPMDLRRVKKQTEFEFYEPAISE